MTCVSSANENYHSSLALINCSHAAASQTMNHCYKLVLSLNVVKTKRQLMLSHSSPLTKNPHFIIFCLSPMVHSPHFIGYAIMYKMQTDSADFQ